MSFARYNLNPRVLEAADNLGWSRPTKVQQKVIPAFLQSLNLVVEAPTGTGKTAAYGFPLISMIDLMKRKTQALVLAPSRELVQQIAAALESFYHGDHLRVGSVYGGQSLDESEAVVRGAYHIVVAAPGRLKDVMSQVQYDYFWRDIRFLIMDEGDKLLEQGFQRDFDDLRANLRNRIQVGFFSATLPDDALAMMRERFNLLKTIQLKPQEVLRSIRFHEVEVPNGERELTLASLLKDRINGQALIFAGRRDDVQDVVNFLRKMGFTSEAYFGTLEQHERANILQRFRDGYVRFLVATDLAARGLDIERLPNVINLNIPEAYDYYLHRVGRTGRMGRKGNVFSLINSPYEAAYLRNHHRLIGLPLKPLDIEPADRAELHTDEGDRWAKFQLSRGKQDKIRKGDVVGFLTNQAELAADEIGTITIYDSYTTVDLPLKGFDKLSERADTLTVKGKSVKIKKFSQEAQKRRAESVKKLLRDRPRKKS